MIRLTAAAKKAIKRGKIHWRTASLSNGNSGSRCSRVSKIRKRKAGKPLTGEVLALQFVISLFLPAFSWFPPTLLLCVSRETLCFPFFFGLRSVCPIFQPFPLLSLHRVASPFRTFSFLCQAPEKRTWNAPRANRAPSPTTSLTGRPAPSTGCKFVVVLFGEKDVLKPWQGKKKPTTIARLQVIKLFMIICPIGWPPELSPKGGQKKDN